MTKLFCLGLVLAVVACASALSHSEALSRLQNAGINTNNKCTDRYNSGCTSLDGIRENTIDKLISFKYACGCPMVVTGGTEVGHASTHTESHENGYKIDLRLNSCLNTYIPREFTYQGRRGVDNARLYKDQNGDIYAKEFNHWDITYY